MIEVRERRERGRWEMGVGWEFYNSWQGERIRTGLGERGREMWRRDAVWIVEKAKWKKSS